MLKVIDIVSLGNIDKDEILKIFVFMEVSLEYLLGKVIYDEVKEKNINLYDVKNFLVILGRGVIGEIEVKKYLLGNKKLFFDNNIKDLYEEEIYKYEL